MQLEYDGTQFSGWQFQPGLRTVQEACEEAWLRVVKDQGRFVGCGRTDAGVHAKKFTAHVDVKQLPECSLHELKFRLNRALPADVAIQEIIPVIENAHARFSAKSRSYEYLIRDYKSSVGAQQAWEMRELPDLELMNIAAKRVVGYHDFYSFCKSPEQQETTKCSVMEAIWTLEDRHLKLHITANRFLRNMVRSLVGHFVDVGTGRISVTEMLQHLDRHEQHMPSQPVPACGLYLTDVAYNMDELRLPVTPANAQQSSNL